MRYVILETWPDDKAIALVVGPDGNTAVFDNKELADEVAEAECQRGLVVEIP